MKLHVIAAFDWAHAGIVVERFEPGQEIETDDQDLIEVSERESWAVREGAKASVAALVPDPAPTPEPEPEPEKVFDPAPAPEAAAPASTGGRRKK